MAVLLVAAVILGRDFSAFRAKHSLAPTTRVTQILTVDAYELIAPVTKC